MSVNVGTPLWAKCEDETHIPKSGDLESSGAPENSELDCRGQNTSHRGVLYINEKVLKCRCPKWPHMIQLDICSPSYGQKKGRESNWQFDSRPLNIGNQPLPDVCRRSATWHWKALKESYNFGLDLTPIGGWSQEIWRYEFLKSREFNLGQFRDSSLGVPGKSAIQMWLPQSNAENTIWGKVVASPESGSW
jgi:hypothetical protein